MGSVFKRKGSRFWGLWFIDVSGKRRDVSSGTEDEKKARALLDSLERQVEAQRVAGVTQDSGPLTLLRYGERWLKRREASGLDAAVADRSRWKTWIAPHPISALVLADVRPRHVRDFIAEMAKQTTRRGGPPSPRLTNHVYGLLRVLFSDAVAEELLQASPCVLRARRKELPRKKDADPTWRGRAVFTRAEVEQLISDPHIPEDRRVLYALLFLTGMRFGELSDRKWSDLDLSTERLPRLTVATSFHSQKKLSKSTKTDVVREVPVHPVLATILAEWKGGGWERMLGRAPTDADWILPSRHGEQRRSNHALRRFHEDCERLGLRERRIHDTRRTFISLAMAGGASKDLLRWVTHAPPADQFSQYMTPPWSALCLAVLCFSIQLQGESGVAAMWQSEAEKKKPTKSEDLMGSPLARSRGLEPLTSGVTGRRSNQLN